MEHRFNEVPRAREIFSLYRGFVISKPRFSEFLAILRSHVDSCH